MKWTQQPEKILGDLRWHLAGAVIIVGAAASFSETLSLAPGTKGGLNFALLLLAALTIGVFFQMAFRHLGRVSDQLAKGHEEFDERSKRLGELGRHLKNASDRLAKEHEAFDERSKGLGELGRHLKNASDRLAKEHEAFDERSKKLGELVGKLSAAADMLSTKRNTPETLEHIRIEKEFKKKLKASRIRELPAVQIFPELADCSVPLGAIEPESGQSNQADLLVVCGLAKVRNAKRIFEFGTYLGRTTYHLAKLLPEVQIVTLDLPEEQIPRPGPYVGFFFKNAPQQKQIHQIFSDSRDFDTAPYRHQFDFIWVDADHSYQLVKNDTLKAFELLAQGGMILWHDYGPKKEGLVNFFREFSQEKPLFRLANTSILLYVDGVDPETFEPAPLPISKSALLPYKRDEDQ